MGNITVFGSAQNWNQEDPRLQDLPDCCVVFGYNTFTETDRSKLPPETTFIFIQRSMAAYLKVVNLGYQNAFTVPSIMGLSMDEIVADLGTTASMNASVARFNKIQALSGYFKQNEDLINNLEMLLTALKERDTKKLGFLMASGIEGLFRNVKVLKQAMKLVDSIPDIWELKKTASTLQEQYAIAERKLRELEESKASRSADGVDTTSLFGDAQDLSHEISILKSAYEGTMKSLAEAKEESAREVESRREVELAKKDLEELNASLQGNLEVAQNTVAELEERLKGIENDLSKAERDHSAEITGLNALLEQKRLEEEKKTLEFTDHIDGLSNEILQLGKEKSDVELQLSEARAKIQNLESKLAVAQNDLEAAKEAYDKVNAEFRKNAELVIRARKVIEDYQMKEDAVNKDKTIQSLREELAKATRTSINPQAISEQLPIISSDKMVLKCDKLVVFRELKPAIYMNTLLQQLNTVCVQKLLNERNKTFIILVFDFMTDQFRCHKYKKARFAINALPDLADNGNMIAVTNKIDMDFFRNTMKLHTFDYIFVIDRFGLLRPIVNHPKAYDFYLIDSSTDVSDFRVDKSKCIIYGKSDLIQYRASVTPEGSLFDKDDEGRAFKFYQSKLVTNILMELKII